MTPFSLKFLLKTQYKVPLRNTHEAKKSQRHRKLKENSKMWNVTNPKSHAGCQPHFTLIYWQHKNWNLKIIGSDLKPDLSAEDKSSLSAASFSIVISSLAFFRLWVAGSDIVINLFILSLLQKWLAQHYLLLAFHKVYIINVGSIYSEV